MSEKPISFSVDMVIQILKGNKSMTRRLANGIKPCPYKVGDLLYIREPYSVLHKHDELKPTFVPVIESDVCRVADVTENGCSSMDIRFGRIRPGRFMTKWMARPERLLVTSVRKEKLQDITDDDARKEGVGFMARGMSRYHGELVHLFKNLWESINGHRQGAAWSYNPEVHVISFEVQGKPEGEI